MASMVQVRYQQGHDPREDRRAAYVRSLDRAIKCKLTCWRTDDPLIFGVSSSSSVSKTHRVRVTGTLWFDLSCTCQGFRSYACMHRALVAWCRKYQHFTVKPDRMDLEDAMAWSEVLASYVKADKEG